MEIKICSKGHSYNAMLSQCPECAAKANGTMPLEFPNAFDFGAEFASGNDIGMFNDAAPGGTAPVKVNKNNGGTSPVTPGFDASFNGASLSADDNWANQNSYRQAGAIPSNQDYNATQSVEINRGIPLVSGWLVCIEGPEKGKDYRLHTDYNYIGRSSRMDVCITDETVSRENHAIIAHDARSDTFFFAPASGRTMVRHNGRIVMSTVELKRGDRLEIGRGVFLFVPFCGEDFKW